ncbi:MAG: MarR family transcriptional regulator [Victivallaceae bacterium]|nr:MarR family transcriptional regulator [Victivallaceae bacterium]
MTDIGKFWRKLATIVYFIGDETLRKGEDGTISFRDLTVSQTQMLRTIYVMTLDYPEGVSLKSLAERMCITPASASGMVDLLVRRSFLERRQSDEDRRAVKIRLSDNMRSRSDAFEMACAERLMRLTGKLSPEEQQMFERIVCKMHDVIGEI